MDPRNPLSRLDALAQSGAVRRLAVRFEKDGRKFVRRVEVELEDGKRRSFAVSEHASWIDLLDRAARIVAVAEAARGSRRR